MSKAPKDPKTMTPGEINKELDRLRERDSKNTRAFIEAGRGHERPSEYLKQTDPLSLEARSIFDRRTALMNEIERRYGPGMCGSCPVKLRSTPRRKL